jgi:hypothetical protein
MVKEILTEAGFVENKTFKETRFIKPPKTTYAIYLLDISRYGADDGNLITEHSDTIEIYSYKPDPEAERRIEAALDKRAIPFDKQSRYWLQEEQLYQTIYTYDYIEK